MSSPHVSQQHHHTANTSPRVPSCSTLAAPLHIQQGHLPTDCFLVSCKREFMQITTTSNSSTHSKSHWFFQTGFLQLRLPVKAPHSRTREGDKGAVLAELTWQSTLLALCSHMMMTLVSLTQHMHCISEQSGNTAVMISSAGSSAQLGMSALPRRFARATFLTEKGQLELPRCRWVCMTRPHSPPRAWPAPGITLSLVLTILEQDHGMT